jgi:hypothetical protein
MVRTLDPDVDDAIAAALALPVGDPPGKAGQMIQFTVQTVIAMIQTGSCQPGSLPVPGRSGLTTNVSQTLSIVAPDASSD